MLYAIVNGEKESPTISGQKAICPITNQPMFAKCGQYKIWHWSYYPNSIQIQTNKENETEWHINWKKYFDKNYIEIIHTDKLGNIHIADYDDTVNLIEFQHSPISSQELKTRELFYTSINRNMIWIVDAEARLNYQPKKIVTQVVNFKLPFCSKQHREEILKHSFNVTLGNIIINHSEVNKYNWKMYDGGTEFQEINYNQNVIDYLNQNNLTNKIIDFIQTETSTEYNFNVTTCCNILTDSNTLILLHFKTENLILDYVNNNVYTVEDFIKNYKSIIKPKKKQISIKLNFNN